MCAILACVCTFDLFTHPDRSITFDGRVHITTISMYHDLLVKGKFPIVWVDAWGNYGFPLGLISYQATSYVGGLLQIVVGSPTAAYNALFWIATFGSAVLAFVWFRGHVGEKAALISMIFFVLAPYHIQNIYVRGALPEYVSTVFLLLTLIGVQKVFEMNRRAGCIAVLSGTLLLALTHPMMLVTGSLVLIPYTLYMWQATGRSVVRLLRVGVCASTGLLLASFYLLPLLLEIKYFYYGVGDKLRPSGFLSLEQLLSPLAPYFGSSHPGPPGLSLRLGVLESIAVALGTLFVAVKSKEKRQFFFFVLVLTLVLIALILPASLPLFAHVTFLNNLQYPWRLLSVVSLVIPLLIALLFDAYGNSVHFVMLVCLLFFTRVPQLYGKDYVLTPLSAYQFTETNLHTKNMAPVWAGESADYPVHREKVAIVEGTGELSNLHIENSRRDFHVHATTTVRMADYTFFFPGWKVYVDGTEVNPEFQDPKYRGVITYHLSPGDHDVSVRFISTRIRKVGAGLSFVTSATLITFTAYLYARKSRRAVR